VKPTELGTIGLRYRDQLVTKLKTVAQCKAAAEAINTCRLLAGGDLEGKLFHIEMACYRRADAIKAEQARGRRE
jgi:hypothetical protein